MNKSLRFVVFALITGAIVGNVLLPHVHAQGSLDLITTNGCLSSTVSSPSVQVMASHQNASEVVPLLKKIKLGDSVSKVQKILGHGLTPDVDRAGQVMWYCMLDDGSVVHVGDTHHIVVSITVIDAKRHVIYSTSQAAK